MKDVIAGTVVNYCILSIPTPTSNGIDEVLKILAAGIVSFSMAWLHAKLKERNPKRKTQKKDVE